MTMEKELWFKRDALTQNVTKGYKIKLLIWRCVDTLLFKTSLNPLSSWRIFLLRSFGAKVGRGCYISPKCTIFIPWNIEIGNFVSIDDYAYIKPRTKIIIGDYVSIANFVHIIPGGHNIRERNFTHSHSAYSYVFGSLLHLQKLRFKSGFTFRYGMQSGFCNSDFRYDSNSGSFRRCRV